MATKKKDNKVPKSSAAEEPPVNTVTGGTTGIHNPMDGDPPVAPPPGLLPGGAYGVGIDLVVDSEDDEE